MKGRTAGTNERQTHMAEPLFHVFVDDHGFRNVRTDDELLAHLHGMTRAKESYHIDYVNTFGDSTRVGSGERDRFGTWTVHQLWDSTDRVWAGVDCENITDYLTFPDDDINESAPWIADDGAGWCACPNGHAYKYDGNTDDTGCPICGAEFPVDNE